MLGYSQFSVYQVRPEGAIHHQPGAERRLPGGAAPRESDAARPSPPCKPLPALLGAGREEVCRAGNFWRHRTPGRCPGLMMNCPFGACQVHVQFLQTISS